MRRSFGLLLLATLALAGEREITSCEICGGSVYQTPKEYVSGDTRYVYIDEPPHKRYCVRCQRDINNGEIDPDDPPALAPRDDEELGHNPYGNPYAAHADRLTREQGKPRARKTGEEEEGGFGALWYAAAIVVAVGFALRYFLK